MALKILHFTPEVEAGSPFAQYIDMLLYKMSQRADTYLVTHAPLSSGPSTNIPTYSIDDSERRPFYKKCSTLLALQRRYLQTLYSIKPDVVHIHGSWNFLCSRIALWSRKRGFKVILSPFYSLEVNEEQTDYGMKMWKMISYQKSMLRHASAIHLTDGSSYRAIMEKKLNARTLLMEDFDSQNESDYDRLANELMLLYRKVLDSDAVGQMDVNSDEALSSLLHVGMAREMPQQILPPESILNLRSIKPTAWRYIDLYSYDQGVSDILQEGVNRMQLRLPDLQAEQVDRFPSRLRRDKSPLPSDLLLSEDRKMRKRLNELLDRDEETERKVLVMVLNIKHHYEGKTLSLRPLCDLYDVLRHEDYDEERVSETAERLGIHTLLRRLCQLLYETVYLEEGFMPVYRLDDPGTERMRQYMIAY